MAFKRIVAKSEEDLKTIIKNIKNWFETTDSYKTDKITEKRKFQDPDTKEIIEKDIDVLKVQEPLKDKNGKIIDYKKATIKFVPMKVKNEMKIEIGGEGETVIAGKISNQIGDKGTLKSYSKDKKVAIKESTLIKKSELKEIIKEEIKNLLKEEKPYVKVIYDNPFKITTIQGVANDGYFKGITVKGNFEEEFKKKYDDIDYAIRDIQRNSNKFQILDILK